MRNTFISNTRLKLAKNQTKAKQYPEAELFLFENYSLLFKNSSKCFKKWTKQTSVSDLISKIL